MSTEVACGRRKGNETKTERNECRRKGVGKEKKAGNTSETYEI
jgi:hypothetical protein